MLLLSAQHPWSATEKTGHPGLASELGESAACATPMTAEGVCRAGFNSAIMLCVVCEVLLSCQSYSRRVQNANVQQTVKITADTLKD